MSQNPEKAFLPSNGETLWTITVKPSLEGSGILPMDPIFPEESEMDQIPPELQDLMDSFDPRFHGDMPQGTFP